MSTNLMDRGPDKSFAHHVKNKEIQIGCTFPGQVKLEIYLSEGQAQALYNYAPSVSYALVKYHACP